MNQRHAVQFQLSSSSILQLKESIKIEYNFNTDSCKLTPEENKGCENNMKCSNLGQVKNPKRKNGSWVERPRRMWKLDVPEVIRKKHRC